MKALRLLLCSAVAAAAASTPRLVAKYTKEDVYTVHAVEDDVFYALTFNGGGDDYLIAVEFDGVWGGTGNASFTTPYKQEWPGSVVATGEFGFVQHGGFLRAIMDGPLTIDVRNKTSPKVLTTGPEAYGAQCFFTTNGTTYAARVRGDATGRLFVDLVDVRQPAVAVGTFELPGAERDIELGSPRCDATLGLMLVSPWMADISDVTAPKLLRRLPLSTKQDYDIEDFELDARRKLMFTWSFNVLRTWDIANPADPQLVSAYEVPFANRTVVPQRLARGKGARRVGGTLHGGFFMRLVGDVLYIGVPMGATMVSTASPTHPVNFATIDLNAGVCVSFHVHETPSAVYGVWTGETDGNAVYFMELGTK